MDASTRLYKRLGEIPEDSNDPESLADLLVCAFGAFERYYVCWKTTGGDYRQGRQACARFRIVTHELQIATTYRQHCDNGSTLPTVQRAILQVCKSFSDAVKNISLQTKTASRSTRSQKSRNWLIMKRSPRSEEQERCRFCGHYQTLAQDWNRLRTRRQRVNVLQ